MKRRVPVAYRLSRAPNLRAAAVALLSGLGAFGACDPSGDANSGTPELCDPAIHKTVNASGLWKVTGSARRTDCENEAWNSDSVVLTGANLMVSQMGNSLVLSPGGGVQANGDGTVKGLCVNLTVRESTKDGPLELAFKGTSVAAGEVTGTVTGKGPGSCRLNGSFSASTTCCSGTGPNASDAPPVEVPRESDSQP